VDCEQFASGLANPICKLQSLFLTFEDTDFAEDGDFDVLGECFYYFLYEFGFFQ
jgi:hypothetical protein